MKIEKQLQALKGKRILYHGKAYLVKSAKKINSLYLFITDSKVMNLDRESAEKLINNHKILE